MMIISKTTKMFIFLLVLSMWTYINLLDVSSQERKPLNQSNELEKEHFCFSFSLLTTLHWSVYFSVIRIWYVFINTRIYLFTYVDKNLVQQVVHIAVPMTEASELFVGYNYYCSQMFISHLSITFQNPWRYYYDAELLLLTWQLTNCLMDLSSAHLK